MNIKSCITFISSMLCLFTSPAQAQWILIDDFESYEEGTYSGDEGNLFYPVARAGGVGQVDIFTGIEGIGGEKAAWFWFGRVLADLGGLWHSIPLPMYVEPNEQATFYFRIWNSSFDLNWHFMVSKVAAGDEPDNTAIWGNQSAIIRYDSAEPIDIDVHSGGYIPSNPRLTPELATWYEFWMVVDNSFDANNEQVDVGGYQVYYRGPDDPDPILMTFGGDSLTDTMIFRNKAYTSLKSITLIQYNFGTGIYLIDDMYMSPGVNLTDPRVPVDGTQWCGLEKAGMDVDTEDFMGWIWVGSLTGAGWVYSYDLDGFVYLAACPDDSGAWAWVLN